jgi:hypothetical protein
MTCCMMFSQFKEILIFAVFLLLTHLLLSVKLLQYYRFLHLKFRFCASLLFIFLIIIFSGWLLMLRFLDIFLNNTKLY